MSSSRAGPIVHLVNCGGSGSHFIGDVIASIVGGVNVHEVYPPQIFSLGSPEQRLTDVAVYRLHRFAHATMVHNSEPSPTIVTSHYRPDTEIISDAEDTAVLLLIRDPYHIAISRAFRKEQYKQETAPDVADVEYLRRQARHVRHFFDWASNVKLQLIRYEDVVGGAFYRVDDVLHPVPLPKVVSARNAIDHHIGGPTSGAGNYNPKPPPRLEIEQQRILHDELGEHRTRLGYPMDDGPAQGKNETISHTEVANRGVEDLR